MEKLNDLMLVGRVPQDTAEEAFRVAGPALGKELSFLPDGEVGHRRKFISHLGFRVYHGHPEIETIVRPAAVDGIADTWIGASYKDSWQFRVKPGISRVRFGDAGWRLGYAEPALSSYFVFRTLREKGLFPSHVRFQVTIPLAAYGCYTFFPDPADWPKVVPGYEEAMRAEIAKIAGKIPHDDLTIQFDQPAVYDFDEPDRGAHHITAMTKERYARAVAALAPSVPEKALLGFHLCYGTLEDWPCRRPRLEKLVDSANLVTESAGRRVDYLHLPILDHEPDEYYEGFRGLRIGNARPYLGVIHNMQDPEDFRRRLEQSCRHLKDFGIAFPCGLGRYPRAQ